MAITTDILETYRRPRAVIRRKLDQGLREDRALVTLMLACGLFFVASWPSVSREAHLARMAAEQAGTPLDQVPSLQALMGIRLFVLLFIAPLIFYGVAAVSHLAARAFGGRGTAYGARLALFWSLLAISPLMLFQGLLGGFLGAGPAVTLVGLGVLAAFLYLWGSTLVEAERS